MKLKLSKGYTNTVEINDVATGIFAAAEEDACYHIRIDTVIMSRLFTQRITLPKSFLRHLGNFLLALADEEGV